MPRRVARSPPSRCCLAVPSVVGARRAAAGAAARRLRAAGRRPGRRPVPPARQPVRAGQPGARVRHGAGHGGPRRRRRRRHVRRAGGGHPPRHRPAPRRAAHHRTRYLRRVDVVVGSAGRAGATVLGTTAGHLHLGARVGDAYLDPAVAVRHGGPPHVRARARSTTRPAAATGGSAAPSASSSAVSAVWRRGRGRAAPPTGCWRAAAPTVDWLRGDGGQLLRTAAHYLEPQQLRLAAPSGRRCCDPRQRRRAAARAPPHGDAAPAAANRAAGRRRSWPGSGSTSQQRRIDDVDDGGPRLRRRPTSCGSATPAAARPRPAGRLRVDPGLARTTRPTPSTTSVRARRSSPTSSSRSRPRRPGVPIDLVAHSQGGVVARLALLELERAARRGLARSPRPGGHAGHAPRRRRPRHGDLRGRHARSGGSRLLDGVGLSSARARRRRAPASQQLSGDLRPDRASWPPRRCRRACEAVSIAARGDLVVPVPRTAGPGPPEVVVPVDGSAGPRRPARRARGPPGAGPGPGRAAADLPVASRTRSLDQAGGGRRSAGRRTAGAAAWLGACGSVGRPSGG